MVTPFNQLAKEDRIKSPRLNSPAAGYGLGAGMGLLTGGGLMGLARKRPDDIKPGALKFLRSKKGAALMLLGLPAFLAAYSRGLQGSLDTPLKNKRLDKLNTPLTSLFLNINALRGAAMAPKIISQDIKHLRQRKR